MLLVLLLCACNRRDSGEDVRVVQHQLSVGDVAVEAIERSTKPTAIYFVTLTDVPEGDTVRLECEWRDPHGAVVHRNHYKTRRVDHSPWKTHCRCTFAATSQPGLWSVTMLAGDRILSKKEFEVR